MTFLDKLLCVLLGHHWAMVQFGAGSSPDYTIRFQYRCRRCGAAQEEDI